MGMYQCEILFGLREGLRIQAVVETATGTPCPCKLGSQCILDLSPVVMKRPTPAGG